MNRISLLRIVVGKTCQRNMTTSPDPLILKDFVCNGKKILGAGLNYMDVVRARNAPVPKEPIIFSKPTTSYLKEGSPIVIPKVFSKVTYEVELGIVIGKRCKNVSKDEAMGYVGGYCLALDMTALCHLTVARANGHPWDLGKGFDTSTPVSDFIPAEAIKNPHDLQLWLKLNGENRQNGNTKDLIFKTADLISYISQYMTLEPNDLILTGTPDGAAQVKAGDVIECGMGDNLCLRFDVVDETCSR